MVTDGNFTLTYDAENRLVQVDPASSGLLAPAAEPVTTETPTVEPTATVTAPAPTEKTEKPVVKTIAVKRGADGSLIGTITTN